ncbi:hypothetical protein NC652_004809 [Populus alba x Populus x berolinensis]|nr:hypothetical protein NC652_004809 [Populus alba x Populus x berolinensis]
MVKGGLLKDDANWATLGVKEGQKLMMMGTADEIVKTPEKGPVFMEDLPEEEQMVAVVTTDLHMIQKDWVSRPTLLSLVHEIVGQVTGVGSKVEKFKVGDKVGGKVHGWIMPCLRLVVMTVSKITAQKQYSPVVANSMTEPPQTEASQTLWSADDSLCIFRIPENLPLDAGAPLRCAGITVV